MHIRKEYTIVTIWVDNRVFIKGLGTYKNWSKCLPFDNKMVYFDKFLFNLVSYLIKFYQKRTEGQVAGRIIWNEPTRLARKPSLKTIIEARLWKVVRMMMHACQQKLGISSTKVYFWKFPWYHKFVIFLK